MITISVVIPSWNGIEHLRRNLPAVSALGADEIIVVDDASSDDTSEFLTTHYPNIRVIHHSVNQRFPRTANDGFQAAKGDVVVLLNQDLKPDKHLLKSVLPHFKDPKIFAVTFNEQGRSWAKANLVNGFINFTNGKLDDQLHLSFWASGGSAAFRKSLWHQLSGFDVAFSPGYYEDLDIGYRAYKRGFRIIWDPNCLVEHETESSFNKAFSQKQLTVIKERNYLICHWKNLDSPNLLHHLASLLWRVLKNPGFFRPVLAAIPFLPAILIFRSREKNFIKVSDTAVFQLIDHGL